VSGNPQENGYSKQSPKCLPLPNIFDLSLHRPTLLSVAPSFSLQLKRSYLGNRISGLFSRNIPYFEILLICVLAVKRSEAKKRERNGIKTQHDKKTTCIPYGIFRFSAA
jgi:hypothetical protein